ncbi:MAG: hypothetical protein J6J60_06515 [Clostridia bacterium]|nr:hypothetical protein [Clostridia bacterium]
MIVLSYKNVMKKKILFIIIFLLAIYLLMSISKFCISYKIHDLYTSTTSLNNYHFKVNNYTISEGKKSLGPTSEVFYKDNILKTIITTEIPNQEPTITTIWIDFNKKIAYTLEQKELIKKVENFSHFSTLKTQIHQLKPNAYDNYTKWVNYVAALIPYYSIKSDNDSYIYTYPAIGSKNSRIVETIDKKTGLLKETIQYHKYKTVYYEYEFEENIVSDSDLDISNYVLYENN